MRGVDRRRPKVTGTHKWQISEVVPRNERPNRPETTLPQQQASGGVQEAQEADTGVSTGAGAANDTRKSNRARKPKRRN